MDKDQEDFLDNEPFREDDGSYTNLNPMTFHHHNPLFGRQDSLSIASELQQKDKERNQSTFMEADVNIENYLKELREDETYGDDPIQEDPELAKTAFAMEQSVAYESMHHNRLSHLAHGVSTTAHPFEGQGISLGSQLAMSNHRGPMLSNHCGLLDDPMDDLFNIDVPHSSHHQGPIISTQAPLLKQVKHEPWEDEPSTSALTRPTITPPKTTVVPKFVTPALPRQTQVKTNGYHPTTKARKYNLKPKEEKETSNYKIKRMRNNDAVRRSRMKAKEEQEKRDKELQDLRNEKNKTEQENKILRATLLEMQRKCRCGGANNLKI